MWSTMTCSATSRSVPIRTWEQDPLLAFRLLVDIGLRAQSPAINDPATCRHSINAVSGLLRYLADRHLTIGDITDPGGQVRLCFEH